jgi:peptidoglycan/LPS O-acetylase OafA/YrhL
VVTAIAPMVRIGAYFAGLPMLGAQTIIGNMDLLMIGCLLALANAQHPALVAAVVEWRPTAGRTAAVAAFCGAQWVTGPGTGWFTVPLRPMMEAMIVAYLIASLIAVRRGAMYRALNWAPVAWVGVLSYSLYIWQQFFLYPRDYTTDDAFTFQTLPLSFALTAIAAVLSYNVVELPFLRLKDRWAARSSPTTTLQAAAE